MNLFKRAVDDDLIEAQFILSKLYELLEKQDRGISKQKNHHMKKCANNNHSKA
jgi:hypothetical protein